MQKRNVFTKSGAFTLVELLVVIGIIALLISILLPALNRARSRAAVVKCSAQMHGIGIALAAFAADNKGRLPPFSGEETGGNYIDPTGAGNDFPKIYTLTNAVGNNPPAITPANNEAGSGLGRLIIKKYLRGANVYVCPSANPDLTGVRRVSVNGDIIGRTDDAYYFNPHPAIRTTGATQRGVAWWTKLSGYGKVPETVNLGGTATATRQFKRAIVTDPIKTLETSPHINGKARSWNFLYPDGSVQTSFVSTKVGRGNVGSWIPFLQLSNGLQALVDGRTNEAGLLAGIKSAGTAGGWDQVPLDPGGGR